MTVFTCNFTIYFTLLLTYYLKYFLFPFLCLTIRSILHDLYLIAHQSCSLLYLMSLALIYSLLFKLLDITVYKLMLLAYRWLTTAWRWFCPFVSLIIDICYYKMMYNLLGASWWCATNICLVIVTLSTIINPPCKFPGSTSLVSLKSMSTRQQMSLPAPSSSSMTSGRAAYLPTNRSCPSCGAGFSPLLLLTLLEAILTS